MNATLPLAFGAGLMAALAATPSLAEGGACTTRSPAHTVALLELFTSEGCSSCPPADRWLSGLRSADGLAGKVLPLALHVDYWDYIGWKDAYAQPAFAARQRRLAAQAGNAVVYTPQFFLQGKPYRPTADLAAEVALLQRRPPRADIALTLDSMADGKLTVRLAAHLREGQAAGSAGLFVVLYENGLESRVQAGENRGATLRHDFVVRRWVGPRPLPAGGEQTLTFELAPGWQARNLGVTAFIQDTASQDVLQAVSQPVCG